MRITEITDKKIEKMSSLVEDMLEAGGKLMLCLEKLSNEDMFGERSSYGERSRYRGGDMMGDRRYMGMRSRDMEDDDEMWGERRSTRRMR